MDHNRRYDDRRRMRRLAERLLARYHRRLFSTGAMQADGLQAQNRAGIASMRDMSGCKSDHGHFWTNMACHTAAAPTTSGAAAATARLGISLGPLHWPVSDALCSRFLAGLAPHYLRELNLSYRRLCHLAHQFALLLSCIERPVVTGHRLSSCCYLAPGSRFTGKQTLMDLPRRTVHVMPAPSETDEQEENGGVAALESSSPSSPSSADSAPSSAERPRPPIWMTAEEAGASKNLLDDWMVRVEIFECDPDGMTVNGEMEAISVPRLGANAENTRLHSTSSSIKTLFYGELIDFSSRHSLLSESDLSLLEADVRFWRALSPFRHMNDFDFVETLLDPASLERLAQRYVLMRWKEICFVGGKDNASTAMDTGLTIAGFYYCCLDRSSGQIEGFYFDPCSTIALQCLDLVAVKKNKQFPNIVIA